MVADHNERKVEMPELTHSEQALKVASFNGIDVYNIRTEKFKTNTINIFFHDNLEKGRAAKNALLPSVMRRGCETLPTFRDIAMKLEGMYGAVFDCSAAKKGEIQLVHFYMEYVADKYTGEKTKLFDQAFDLITDIINKPLLENGVFKTDYVNQEKDNLRKLIASRVNDKVQYAVDRCFEVMCKDEPFGIYEYGSAEDVDAITPEQLTQYYREFIETLPVSVYITGQIDDRQLARVKEALSNIKRGTVKKLKSGTVTGHTGEVKNINEDMSVSQGKLSIGFRTNICAKDHDYYRLFVCNIILGGGGFLNSKLFLNVREKESLCYYAFSRLDKYMGLMVISSGIEIEKRNKAQEVILKQLEAIQQGDVSDNELDGALKTIETGIKSMKDSQLSIVDFYLSQAVAGTSDTLDSLIEKARKVTRQDVVEVSKKVQLDTVYFLSGRQNGQNASAEQ